MTNTRYEKVVEAKELLQKFKEEQEEECGIDVTELFKTAPDTVAMAAVLMASSFSYQSGWCMPSTREALRFYDEAERRFWDGEGIPLRYDSYDQLTGQYEQFFLFQPEQEYYIEVPDEICQCLGTRACDYAWVKGEWTRQDVLPLIHNLEKMLAEMSASFSYAYFITVITIPSYCCSKINLTATFSSEIIAGRIYL